MGGTSTFGTDRRASASGYRDAPFHTVCTGAGRQARRTAPCAPGSFGALLPHSLRAEGRDYLGVVGLVAARHGIETPDPKLPDPIFAVVVVDPIHPLDGAMRHVDMARRAERQAVLKVPADT